MSGDRTQPSQGVMDYWLVKLAPVKQADVVLVAARVNISKKQEAGLKLKLMASPNPFSEEVTVTFTVPHTQPVSLKLYDNQSREVATLYQAIAEGGQEYKTTWRAGEYVTGLYILQLKTLNKVSTQKLVLTK